MTAGNWPPSIALMDENALASRMRWIPPEFGADRELSSDQHAIALRQHLERLYLPSEQCLKITNQVLAVAANFSAAAFPDAKTFLARFYGFDRYAEVQSPLPAICLTGLAGVGKSALLAAIKRILGEEFRIDAGGGHIIPRMPALQLKVQDRFTEGMMIRGIVERMNLDFTEVGEASRRSVSSVKESTGHAKRLMYRNQVMLTIIDELQFVTQSASANTVATRLLLLGTYLGPPLIFASNFDMLRRLVNRGQQDRDRLLSKVHVLQPDNFQTEVGRANWTEYLTMTSRLSGGRINLNVKRDAEALHSWTLGIRRKYLFLAEAAFCRALSAGRTQCVLADFEAAFNSSEFGVHRSDVETLTSIALGQRSRRLDLICPPELGASAAKGTEDTAKARQKQNATDQATYDALSQAEKDVAKSIGVPNGKPVATKPPKRRVKGGSSPADLTAGLKKYLGGDT